MYQFAIVHRVNNKIEHVDFVQWSPYLEWTILHRTSRASGLHVNDLRFLVGEDDSFLLKPERGVQVRKNKNTWCVVNAPAKRKDEWQILSLDHDDTKYTGEGTLCHI